ncbi:MAG: GNAT family N-acetyltransferase [Candidatus Altiarchaeia archaeon]
MTPEELRKQVHTLFHKYKYENNDDGHLDIPIRDTKGNIVGHMSPCQAKEVMDTSKLIPLFAQWRNENNYAFASQPKATPEGTSKWYDNYLINLDDRILFIIKTIDGEPIGHMGLWTFDYEKKTCEIDNLIKGKKNPLPGLIMFFAAKALMEWTYANIGVESLGGRMLKDNRAAITFWERLGFTVIGEIPLAKIQDPNVTGWEELNPGDTRKPDRYEVVTTDRKDIYEKNIAKQKQ